MCLALILFLYLSIHPSGVMEIENLSSEFNAENPSNDVSRVKYVFIISEYMMMVVLNPAPNEPII